MRCGQKVCWSSSGRQKTKRHERDERGGLRLAAKDWNRTEKQKWRVCSVSSRAAAGAGVSEGQGNFILLGIFDDASRVERHWRPVNSQNSETCYSTHLCFCLPSSEMAGSY